MTSPTFDVISALKATLNGIRKPAYRSTPKFVRVGVTAADLNGSERPFLAIIYTGEADNMETIGRRHRTRLRLTVYLETSDTESAMEETIALIEDVKDALKTNEMLKPAGSATGLLLVPIAVTNVDAILDLEASAGIGSARIELEAIYRTAHA